MAKRIIYNEQARRALERGIDILAESVAVTPGPKGRNAILEKNLALHKSSMMVQQSQKKLNWKTTLKTLGWH